MTKEEAKIYKINRIALEFYKNLLNDNCGEVARNYLTGREIHNPEGFSLGFASDGNTLLKHIRQYKFSNKDLLASGLFGKSESGRLYDRFRNRVMFPIFDIENNILGFGGRALNNNGPKYLNSPETVIFKKGNNLYGANIAKKSNQDYLILVEGYMDALQLQKNGIINVTATLGTALTEEHAKLLKSMKEKVFLCLDSDEVGQKAAFRAFEKLSDIGISVHIVVLPDSKDPDEYINKYGREDFLKLIENAPEYVSYSIKKLRTVYNIERIGEKLEYISKAISLIGYIKDVNCQKSIVEELSTDTGISPESIWGKLLRNKEKQLKTGF